MEDGQLEEDGREEWWWGWGGGGGGGGGWGDSGVKILKLRTTLRP